MALFFPCSPSSLPLLIYCLCFGRRRRRPSSICLEPIYKFFVPIGIFHSQKELILPILSPPLLLRSDFPWSEKLFKTSTVCLYFAVLFLCVKNHITILIILFYCQNFIFYYVNTCRSNHKYAQHFPARIPSSLRCQR
jgi:hypothetical protein